MTTLITGGCGYIGSHITKFINNYIIVDLNNYTNNPYFIKADITKIDELEQIFINNKITNIMHIAGKAFVKESFDKIDTYYNTNVIGTINILNMMIKYNISKIVFSSSCSVYGNAKNIITENTPLNPISPYGNTKKICEDIIKNYAATYPISYSILRYFNVAGNDNDYIGTDNENNFKRLIPTIILCALKNKVLTINGNDFNTKDGTCVRNYIHVLDIAEAHVKALSYKNNITCNLGSNEIYSILDIIKLVEKYTNKKINYVFGDKIIGDPDIVYCNNELAKTELDFDIKYNIDIIIKSYVDFINTLFFSV